MSENSAKRGTAPRGSEEQTCLQRTAPSEEAAQTDEDILPASTRQSAKANFTSKIFSPLLGHAADPKLVQTIYDLWLWSAVGGARHGSGIGARESLASKPFSPEFWHSKHVALTDLQRQAGLPQLFITVAPYEWSFPYPVSLEQELKQLCRERLKLPVSETLHLAHVLTQLVKGFFTGGNDGAKQTIQLKEGCLNCFIAFECVNICSMRFFCCEGQDVQVRHFWYTQAFPEQSEGNFAG